MSRSPVDVRTLELAAFRAWPAAEVCELAGWRLRATGGMTRRANSVFTAFTAGSGGERPLGERIREAEAFYAARGLPCRFQMSPVSEPPELDRALEERGYAFETPVSIQIADAEAIAAEPLDERVRVESRLSEAWLEVSARQGRFAEMEESYRALLERIGAGARFALGHVDEEPVAVGLGVIDGEWCGVFSMRTLARARRQKLGRGVLAALARAALADGARSLYLQVERDNAPALALYRSMGFVEVYGYHYRTLAGSSVR